MNVVVECDMINKKNIYFYDEVENKIMPDSLFIQTGFSNELFSLSGIYITTEFVVTNTDRYFKKYKYMLHPIGNAAQFDSLIKIEKMILTSIDRPQLTKIYRLKEQLSSLSIILFDGCDTLYNKHVTDRRSLMLKISGIWITDSNCGITFKFFHIND